MSRFNVMPRAKPNHTNDGCPGCQSPPRVQGHTCVAEGCTNQATQALMHVNNPSPGIAARKWFYLCPEHGVQLARSLMVNMGGDGPFNQDYRLRMFTKDAS